MVDLAFFLCGFPKKINSFTDGGLNWHSSSSIFCGSGLTDKGALFSYNANWSSPGRWGLQILTRKNRILFQPLEEIRTQTIGSFEYKKINIIKNNNSFFKEGIYEMTKSFLKKDFKNHCSLSYQIKMYKFYYKMANYKFG